MVGYKKFKVATNATLRVKSENIIATISSKDQNRIDIYVAGLANPFHISVESNEDAHEIMDFIWDRSHDIDRED